MTGSEEYMREALNLAKQGWPQVAPNPMVGCLIVNRGKVVAQGYHQKYGEAHAEVNAILQLLPGINTKDCELYVTLEPCSHHGKTPPCADLIIEKGFSKVIIAAQDPNPLVAGKGIEKLKAAGILVELGVLEDETRWLNRRFYTFFEKKRPFYILKWAQTADGFISRNPVPEKREDNWISGPEAQDFTHHLRTENMAIFVGKNTVLSDNPLLTARHEGGKNPVRLFIDKDLEVPKHFNIYNAASKTIVFNQKREGEEGNISYRKINFEWNVLEQISTILVQASIQSVLVEGGRKLLSDFIQQKSFDEILVIVNPELNFQNGLKAPYMNLSGQFEWLGKDKLYRFLG